MDGSKVSEGSKDSILCLGPVVLDTVVSHVDDLPKRYLAETVNEIALVPGGGAFFSSQVLACFGHEVRVLAQVGNDFAGLHLIATMSSGGLDISNLETSNSLHTSKSVVALDRRGNARYLLYRNAGCDHWSLPHGFDDRLLGLSKEIRHLHISNASDYLPKNGQPLCETIEKMRMYNPSLTVSADMSKLLEKSKRINLLLPQLDYIFGNEFEMKAPARSDVLRDIATFYFEGGVKVVWIKLGNKGAYWSSHEADGVEPGLHFGKAKSENGAGDIFCGAVLHGLVSHRMSLQDATKLGNQVASMHVHGEFDVVSGEKLTVERIQEFSKNAKYSDRVRADWPLWRSTHEPKSYVKNFEDARPVTPENKVWWINRLIEEGALTSESVVLDAGCGPGRFTYTIADMIKCQVIAVDRSPESLNAAHLKGAEFNKDVVERIRWFEGNLDRLEDVIPDHFQQIDAVWLSSALSHMRDNLEKVFDQLFASLRPGGVMLIREMTSELASRAPWYKHFKEAQNYVARRYVPLHEVTHALAKSDFLIKRLQLNDESEKVPRADVIAERYRKDAFSWCAVYKDIPHVFEANLKAMCKDLGNGEVSVFRGRYSILCEKPEG